MTVENPSQRQFLAMPLIRIILSLKLLNSVLGEFSVDFISVFLEDKAMRFFGQIFKWISRGAPTKDVCGL